MKYALLSCLLAASTLLLAAAYTTEFTGVEGDHLMEFAAYMKKFNKKYPVADLGKRFQLYHESLNEVTLHNLAYVNGKYTYKLGMNSNADKSLAEFTGGAPSDPAYNNVPPRVSQMPVPLVRGKGVDLPQSVDFRDQGIINPINPIATQHAFCDVRWSLLTTELQESNYAQRTNKLIKLSEQYCVDCARAYNRSVYEKCNSITFVEECALVVYKNNCTASLNNYPFEDTVGSCHQPKPCAARGFDFIVTEYGKDEAHLEFVASKTPVLAYLTGAIRTPQYTLNRKFVLYAGGVFSGEDTCPKDAATDHGGIVVGYGTDAVQQKEYFILRNSWGADWGEDGYMRIARGEGVCNIGSVLNYYVPPN